jgi:hypothetical protein
MPGNCTEVVISNDTEVVTSNYTGDSAAPGWPQTNEKARRWCDAAGRALVWRGELGGVVDLVGESVVDLVGEVGQLDERIGQLPRLTRCDAASVAVPDDDLAEDDPRA